MGANKVILVGNLGKDPELKYVKDGIAVCTLSLATSERRKGGEGIWEKHTQWHRVVAFGKTAENCAHYLRKGRQLFIEGRIDQERWQDKDGKDRFSTSIVANNIVFLGSARAASEGEGVSEDEEVSSTEEHGEL